jgi:hypothetical protein
MDHIKKICKHPTDILKKIHEEYFQRIPAISMTAISQESPYVDYTPTS